MPPAHEIHNINSEEIGEVIKIGFKFRNSETKTPEEFINSFFSGFRLLTFLKEIK